MIADVLMLRARRLALLGEFIATLECFADRANFIGALQASGAISEQAIDLLTETYLMGSDA